MATKPPVLLTLEQGSKILAEWNSRPKNPPSIAELGKLIFGDGFVARSPEGIAIKNLLASKTEVRGDSQSAPTLVTDLTEEQKQYVINSGKHTKPLEIAKILFANNSLSLKSPETQAVINFIRTMPATTFENKEVKELVENVWKAPEAVDDCVDLINKYDHIGIDKAKISSRQRKEVSSLISYMNTYRFESQMNYYDKNRERELFLSSFVRYTFDKPDLTSEEVDQYIILCEQIVAGKSIEEHVKLLEGLLSDSASADNPQIRMGLVEAISTARKESNDCIVRQNKLYETLVVKRSKRIENTIKENASVLNLVQLWKQEESRLEILKLGDEKKAALGEEYDRLSNMDELKAKMYGLDRERALN